MMGSLRRFTNLLAHVSGDALAGPYSKHDEPQAPRRPRQQGADAKPKAGCRG
jgi:hypothetical protein